MYKFNVEYLKVAGVSEQDLEKLKKKLEVSGDMKPFDEVLQTEYRDFVRIWTLKPPEWWEYMRGMGQTQAKEFTLLSVVSKALKFQIRKVSRVKQDKVKASVVAISGTTEVNGDHT